MLHAGPWARRLAAAAAIAYSIPQTNLIEDWNAQVGGFTIDTTLMSYNGLAPVPTLSGTVPSNLAVWIGVRTAGTLNIGVSTGGLINISLDGGSTFVAQNIPFPISGSISFAVTGGTLTINFPAGTYTINAVYISRPLVWAGTKGAFSWVQDAGQPATNDRGPCLTNRGRLNNGLNRLGRGVMGRLAIASASNGYLVSLTGNVANAVAGGTNQPYHIFHVSSYDANVQSATTQTILGFGRNASNGRLTVVDNVGNGAGNGGYTSARINDAATNANQFNPGGSAASSTTTRIAFVFEQVFDGTNTNYFRSTLTSAGVVNRVQIPAAAVNNSGGALTLTQACLFALKRSTLTSNASASTCRVVLYNAVQANPSAIAATLCAQHDIAQSKVMNICVEGASLSDLSRSDLTWANVMMFGNDQATYTNIASTGASLISTMLPRAPAAGAGTFDFYYNGALASGHNVAFLWAEGVDLGINGGSGNLLGEQAATVSWVSGRHATGWSPVIVKTVIPGGTNPLFESNRVAYNAWLRTGASGADAIDDQAARWPGTPGDNIWYDIGDNIHVSFQGASWIAGSQQVGGSEQLYRYFSGLAP
jgi:hypothetical protein